MDDTKEKDYISEEEIDDVVPICPHCLKPINPYSYYCENCGKGDTHNTPFLPFINIQFSVNFYSKIWNSALDKNNNFGKRFFYFIIIFLFAPIMLVGLLFIKKEPKEKDSAVVEEKEIIKPEEPVDPLDDYQKYVESKDLVDLEGMAQSIDKEAHPDRYDIIIKRIEELKGKQS